MPSAVNCFLESLNAEDAEAPHSPPETAEDYNFLVTAPAAISPAHTPLTTKQSQFSAPSGGAVGLCVLRVKAVVG